MGLQIDLWGFFTGLGLFLLGMVMLEQGLRGTTSRSLTNYLREQTKSPVRGVITGTFATAILQSSSLVGLIVLAFVGAGILRLRNALGVIFGSNLGTTFTGWVVAAIGFKLDLIEFSQPMLVLGAMGTVFLAKDKRPYFYSNILLGIGLLLMGLGEMKAGFASLAENVDVSIFHGHSLIVYLLAGALFTAVIQSSSASMMIVLSALHADIITLHAAAAIVIGADLGTTSTVLLGALKGTIAKKRVAMSHFIFNFITDLLAFLCLPALLYVITHVVVVEDPLYSLVAFHSLFNLLGIIIFVPFVDQFIRLLKWFIGDKPEKSACEFISKVPADITDAAIEAVEKEITELIIKSIALNLRCFKLPTEELFKNKQFPQEGIMTYEDQYARLKRIGGEVVGYTYLIQKIAKDENDTRLITELNHAVRNVTYAAKFIKDIRHNLIDFRHNTSKHVEQSHNNFQNAIKTIYRMFEGLLINRNPELADEHLVEVNTFVRHHYERFIQDIYSVSGEDKITDEETSSLLNVNRVVYLSNLALIEAIQVLLRSYTIHAKTEMLSVKI